MESVQSAQISHGAGRFSCEAMQLFMRQ